MRRRLRGFLMVELAISVALFGAVLLVLLGAITRVGRTARMNEENLHAATRLGEMTEGVRNGDVPVTPGKVRTLATPEDEARLKNETCTIAVEPWPGDRTLSRVTVTVNWRSVRGVDRSVRAVTLVRTDRLKREGGKP